METSLDLGPGMGSEQYGSLGTLLLEEIEFEAVLFQAPDVDRILFAAHMVAVIRKCKVISS